MEVHVKIDPVPKGLNGGDDPGRKRAPGHNHEISGQGPRGAAAEIPQETAIVKGNAKIVSQPRISASWSLREPYRDSL
jgi:hypothetical protein